MGIENLPEVAEFVVWDRRIFKLLVQLVEELTKPEDIISRGEFRPSLRTYATLSCALYELRQSWSVKVSDRLTHVKAAHGFDFDERSSKPRSDFEGIHRGASGQYLDHGHGPSIAHCGPNMDRWRTALPGRAQTQLSPELDRD